VEKGMHGMAFLDELNSNLVFPSKDTAKRPPYLALQ
jgi:hypothetical protein